MRRLYWLLMGGLLFSATVSADEVLPAVSEEDMSAYKSAFGQAIAESKQEKPKGEKENFGSKVSEAARTMKAEILKTEKNFGGWVSKQRRSEKADEHPSMNARAASPGGRPAGTGKPDSAGKPNHSDHPGKGQGKGNN